MKKYLNIVLLILGLFGLGLGTHLFYRVPIYMWLTYEDYVLETSVRFVAIAKALIAATVFLLSSYLVIEMQKYYKRYFFIFLLVYLVSFIYFIIFYGKIDVPNANTFSDSDVVLGRIGLEDIMETIIAMSYLALFVVGTTKLILNYSEEYLVLFRKKTKN